MPNATSFVRWFNEITLQDVPLVGGKNASLGELYRELAAAGVRVPNGFAITADGYRHFMETTGLDAMVAASLQTLDASNLADLASRCLSIRHAITTRDLPADLQDALVSAYARLGDGEPIDVAVRSSATAEDLPDASFAGQQETYLNVRGKAALIEACKRDLEKVVRQEPKPCPTGPSSGELTRHRAGLTKRALRR